MDNLTTRMAVATPPICHYLETRQVMNRLLLTLFTTLALAAPAQAALPGEATYLRIAHKAFPDSCWPITVTYPDPWPAWGSDFDALAYPPTQTDPSRCRMELDPAGWTRREACEKIAHETGHLAGRGHSDNPRSIMYPRNTHNFKPCARYAPRGVLSG